MTKQSHVSVHQAKTHLSRLLVQVLQGEEIIIDKNGIPVARILPFTPPRKKKRLLGKDKNLGWIADDFNAALPESIISEFEK